MISKKAKIVVIGAGIAGLAAARMLIANGFEVVVLEARDRCGGRISIDYSLGLPLGRGAGWIHGINDNPMIQLAEQFHTPYFPFDRSKYFTYDRDGRIISAEDMQNFEHMMASAIQQARTSALQREEDISLAESLSSIINPCQWSPINQDLFIRKQIFFESYVGAEYELLSARNWDEEEEEQGAHVILADGYNAIITGLAESCSIELNTVVKTIRDRKVDVEIVTSQGNIYADTVIVTLPLGVLKKPAIQFDPPLSAAKQAAIDRLGMGLFNIFGLRFPEVFWPEEAQAMFFPNRSIFSPIFNIGGFLNQPILMGYSGGKTARLLEQESDEQVIDKILQQFRVVFKKNIMSPEKYFITRWSQDIYSLGSYSYLPVGASGNDRDLLAQPESNRLFFAGEATHRQFRRLFIGFERSCKNNPNFWVTAH